MKRFRKTGLIFAFAILLIAAAVIALCPTADHKNRTEEFYGYVSRESYREPDGTVANVYASGDQYYNYLHDEKGRILVPDEAGFLRYARNANGAPEAIDVRWNADERTVLSAGAMTADELDLSESPELLNDFGALGAKTNVESAVKNAAASGNGEAKIVNSVVFLQFPDDTGYIVTEGVKKTLSNESGLQNTLNNYYETLSAGTFGFYNVLPYKPDGELFIYTAPKPIAYYRSLPASGWERNRAEGELLEGALLAAREYLERGIEESGCSVDSDADGFADSVTFFVLSSEPGNNAWNTILWPHQWSLQTLSKSVALGGKTADRFLFMFTDSDRFFSVLSHEMGHVIGAPDLYHYTNNSGTPVGYYDNMASSALWLPNLWLTYTREKYLADAVKEWQVVEIDENWDGYTLKATAIAGQSDTLAYKIRLADGEWLYLEYRQPNLGAYDNNLDRNHLNSADSGLVLYRVKEGVYGNADAYAPKLNYSVSPDEIYVFRNDNIAEAALNPDNPVMGNESDTASYRNGNIYTVNGRNTGIVVTVREIDETAGTVRFEVYKKGFSAHTGGGADRSALIGLSASPDTDTDRADGLTVLYGEEFLPAVYPVYRRGASDFIGRDPMPASIFSVEGFDKNSVSGTEQSVKVTLNRESALNSGYPIAEDADFHALRFGVTVKDYEAELIVVSLAAEEFPIGAVSGIVDRWEIKTASGKTSRAFQKDSVETKSLRYEYDAALPGECEVRVSFGSLWTVVNVRFFDVSESFRYAGEQSFEKGTAVETLDFILRYRSGGEVEVALPADDLGFRTDRYGLQVVSVDYAAPDGFRFCFELSLYVSGTVSKSSDYFLADKNGNAVSAALSLRYAEAVDFSDYYLCVNYLNESDSVLIPLKERFPARTLTYSQDLKLEFPEVRIGAANAVVVLRATVGLKSDAAILSAVGKGISIDYKNALVVVSEAMTAGELLLRFKTADYLEIIAKTPADASASGAKFYLANKLTKEVLSGFSMTVVLKGDANGDGVVDYYDLDALAELYLAAESGYRAAVADKNGDGKYSLADFTLWLSELSASDGEGVSDAA